MNIMYNVESYEHAWLNLTKEDLKDTNNPLTGLTDEQKDNFHLYIINIMRQNYRILKHQNYLLVVGHLN